VEGSLVAVAVVILLFTGAGTSLSPGAPQHAGFLLHQNRCKAGLM
jgi:hypothetical protein